MFVHRPILMSEAGLVVSGHHKASEAGASVLRAGGNAIDAAIATSAALCVAVPHMNGLGGDCIALHFQAATRKVTAINGSGCAPGSLTSDAVRQAGHMEMPSRGPLAISVPGLVDAWKTCLERWGSRPIEPLLEPATELASRGVPVDIGLETFLSGPDYAALAAANPALSEIYGPPGQRRLGERLPNPALAETLRALARDGLRSLYDGTVAKALLSDLGHAGAMLSAEDFAAHATRFDAPLTVRLAGRTVHAAPPNSQGIALSAMAGLYEIERSAAGTFAPFAPRSYLDRKRIAFDLRDSVDDPDLVDRPDRRLTPEVLSRLAALPGPSLPLSRPGGDTSTFVVIDRWGNAVSWVQSLFDAFGSGVVSPATGIVLQNRLGLQQLEPASRWPLRAGRRPFHTLCPALVEKDGRCEVTIATPGDHGQPQTILQVLLRLFAEGLHVQAAIEAPRIRHDEGPAVLVESRVPDAWKEEILSRGHDIEDVGPWSRLMGGVNAIVRQPDGLLLGGADPRRASYAVAAD